MSRRQRPLNMPAPYLRRLWLDTAQVAEPAAYPRLKAAKPGDPVQVQGRVTWVQGAQIALHETTLTFPDQSH